MLTKVAVLGASGYTGSELVRLLAAHPHFAIDYLGAHSQAGKKAGEVLPGLAGDLATKTLQPADAAIPDDVALVFTALPHSAAAASVEKALAAGKKVVDLSADFRHKDAATYEEAYGAPHPCPELLHEAVYGLTEFAREQVAKARLVANPGCYPTSVLLPLLPLLKAGVLDPDGIIADAKSGTSGAGRSAKTELLFCDINEGIRAYGLPRHRHTWEMEEWAQALGGQRLSLRFVPHILPMSRGMLTTLHLCGDRPEGWRQILVDAFGDEPFVNILEPEQWPGTKAVAGSNRCDINLAVTGEHEAVVVSCLDNLLKGAAGQAVQNANLMYGWPETAGLSALAVWP